MDASLSVTETVPSLLTVPVTFPLTLRTAFFAMLSDPLVASMAAPLLTMTLPSTATSSVMVRVPSVMVRFLRMTSPVALLISAATSAAVMIPLISTDPLVNVSPPFPARSVTLAELSLSKEAVPATTHPAGTVKELAVASTAANWYPAWSAVELNVNPGMLILMVSMNVYSSATLLASNPAGPTPALSASMAALPAARLSPPT